VVETGRIYRRLPSEVKLPAKVGHLLDVVVDDTDADGIATRRTGARAPEIDGTLFIDAGTDGLSVGEIIRVEVNKVGEYDLWDCLATCE
jgi:ribosomal protein S12 methylthiotransferase